MRLTMLALALAIALLLQGMAAAQDLENIEVPAEGYDGPWTLTSADPSVFYFVHVEEGLELQYSFAVVGNGTVSVFLSPRSDPFNYYTAFSTAEEVASFSRTFPADYGFARDYYIQVNTTSAEDVEFEASIHMSAASKQNYNLYYALIALGFVALVAVSWKLVERQDRMEREEKRRKGKGKGRR